MDQGLKKAQIVAVSILLILIGATLGWRAHQAAFERQIAETIELKELFVQGLEAMGRNNGQDGEPPALREKRPKIRPETKYGIRKI